jgi:cupin 2 domain-containing protein
LGDRGSGNIYAKVPNAKKKEVFQTLARNGKLRIERIVSRGQATPENIWLRESRDEWVIVLKGAAELRFQRSAGRVSLKEGDYIFIPANTPHRVEWTHQRRKTIWLAVTATKPPSNMEAV